MARSLYSLALVLITVGIFVVAGGLAGLPLDILVFSGLFIQAAGFVFCWFYFLQDKHILSNGASDVVWILIGIAIYAVAMNYMGRNLVEIATPFFIFSFVIVFPVAEELFFRDFMYRSLSNEGYPENSLIFLTTLFWVGIHFYAGAWALAFIPLGVLLGLARSRGGAVIWPIIGHALYNAVLFI